MQGKLKDSWRSQLIFILMIIMMVALFCSRPVLSAGIMAFTAISLVHGRLKPQIRNFFSSPLLWGMSLLFLLPLVSGLWSEDKAEWLRMLRIKLPLLFLPFAFAGPPDSNRDRFSKKQWDWLTYTFVFLITVATLWCMYQYLQNISAVNEGYLRAKTMVTPLGNDHVRFSWLISVAALLSGWLWITKRKENNFHAWIFALLFAWLVIFLHILAARTGLISLYIMLAGMLVWLITQKINTVTIGRKYAVAFLLLLLALPFIAYQALPTFQNRVKYILYDFGYFKNNQYLPGANDAVRIISLRAGWELMNKEPFTGVGFGDIRPEIKKWYDKNIPFMLEADKIIPSGEWMKYGAGCGWPGILIFSFVMIIPFRIKTGNRILWWMLNATAAFGFMFDIGLEVQFGVFIYSFVVLWWWKWLKADPEKLATL